MPPNPDDLVWLDDPTASVSLADLRASDEAYRARQEAERPKPKPKPTPAKRPTKAKR